MAPVKEVITRTSVALDATMAEVRDVAVQDPDPGDEVETETVNQGGQGPVTVRRDPVAVTASAAGLVTASAPGSLGPGHVTGGGRRERMEMGMVTSRYV